MMALTPPHSPRNGARISHASLSHNLPHKHPPKELWGRAPFPGGEKPQAQRRGGWIDAPSARRVQPPRLTLAGRSRGATAAAGTLRSGAICSHPLHSQTPEPPPLLPDLPPLRECEPNHESLASLPEKRIRNIDTPPKENKKTLPSRYPLPSLQGVRIAFAAVPPPF